MRRGTKKKIQYSNDYRSGIGNFLQAYSISIETSKKSERINLSRIVVIENFSFFSSKTDFIFEFLVKTYVYAGNFKLIQ